MNDPFADVRGKKFDELNPEQQDRITELQARETIDDVWIGAPVFHSLFRVIDRLRAELADAKATLIRQSEASHKEVRIAVAQERERCAKVCEGTFRVNVYLNDEEAYLD